MAIWGGGHWTPNESCPDISSPGTARRLWVVECKPNPAAFCFWQADPSGITLWVDVRNGGSGIELGKRILLAATIAAEDDPEHSAFEATHELYRKMAIAGVFMPRPLYGGNWYYAYGNSSADDISADTERIASYSPSDGNRPCMVIDDGWSPYRTTGPCGNSKFPDMARLASNMLRMDVEPGL